MPIVDTWWQTETGAMMISPIAGITPTRPTFATLPLPGVQPVLMDEHGNEVVQKNMEPSEGRLAMRAHGLRLQEPFTVITKGIKTPISQPIRICTSPVMAPIAMQAVTSELQVGLTML